MPLKISVIIPAYNVENFLQKAVDSVFATNYPDLEILIIEDGSQDNTLSIAKAIELKHSGVVKVFQHKGGKNRGAGASRNVGIKAASGELIAFLDADDWYLPSRFAECVNIFEKEHGVDGVYEPMNYQFFDKKDLGITWQLLQLVKNKDDSDDSVEITERLSHSCWGTDAITLRKKAFYKSGVFNERLQLGQDYELWLRMSLVCELVRGAGEPVATYRRHEGNRSVASRSAEINLFVYTSFLSWAKNNGVEKERLSYILTTLKSKVFGAITKNLEQGDYSSAGILAVQLAKRCPIILTEKQYWGNIKNIFMSRWENRGNKC